LKEGASKDNSKGKTNGDGIGSADGRNPESDRRWGGSKTEEGKKKNMKR
jgi:hypothetical protein